MSFLSPTFLFLLLPIAVIAYALMPKYRRSEVLPLFSAVIFVSANVGDLFSLLYLVLAVAVLLTGLYLYRKNKSRACLIVSEAVFAAVLVAILVTRLVNGLGFVYHVGSVMMLMAGVSLCSDVLNGKGRVPDTPWDAVIYVTFFPVMFAGPFIGYGDFIEKLDSAVFSPESFVHGAFDVMTGFIKCTAVASVLFEVSDRLLNVTESGLVIAVICGAVYSLAIFAAFSGYSDIGRGLAALFGFSLERDFGSPFVCVTPVGYVKKFFTSFSSFCREYITDKLKKVLPGILGKTIGAVSAAAFFSLIFCRSAGGFTVLFPMMTVIELLMPRERKNDKKVFLPLRVLSAVITFFAVAAVWLVIREGGIGAFSSYVGGLSGNAFFDVSLDARAVFSNLKYTVLPLTAYAVVLLTRYVSDRNARLEAKGAEPGAGIYAAKYLTALLVLGVFCLSVVLLLPQFPDLASKPFDFYFV